MKSVETFDRTELRSTTVVEKQVSAATLSVKKTTLISPCPRIASDRFSEKCFLSLFFSRITYNLDRSKEVS